MEAARWRGAKVVSAIGIIPIALDFLRGNENVLPVLPAPRVNVAADVVDLSRVAISIVATAADGIVRHVPCRIKFLMQRSILRGMMAVLRRCGRDCENESRRKKFPSHAP